VVVRDERLWPVDHKRTGLATHNQPPVPISSYTREPENVMSAVLQVSAATAAAAAAATAMWHCYRDVSPELGWSRPPVDRREAAVLEDILCGLRHQQLFQLHLLRQLQRQIDQLVVGEALLAGRRGQQVPVGPGSPPAAAAAAAPSPSPYHVTSMTSHRSPMSAMMDMSRKQLSQLPTPHADRTPPAERE